MGRTKNLAHEDVPRQKMLSVYLDIETIPSETKPTLDEIAAPKNYKNPEAIKAYKVGAVEKEYRKQSLISHKGKIFCISFAVGDKKPISLWNKDDEEKLMNDFQERYLKEVGYNYVKLIGHNILGFDLKWLYQRAWKYNLKELLGKLPLQDGLVFDTMKIFRILDYKDMVSMDNVAKFFGIEGKTNMTGKDVYDAYLKGEYKKIVKYCESDVILTRKIFKKMKFE